MTDGRTGGRIDGWTDGRADGRVDGRIEMRGDGDASKNRHFFHERKEKSGDKGFMVIIQISLHTYLCSLWRNINRSFISRVSGILSLIGF